MERRPPPEVRTYRDLKVWQEAMQLVKDTYRLTAHLPKDEAYGLTTQLRRASVSIPANIAEGYGRGVTGSYVQFLRIARGSLRELETHLLLVSRLGLREAPSVERLSATRLRTPLRVPTSQSQDCAPPRPSQDQTTTTGYNQSSPDFATRFVWPDCRRPRSAVGRS